MKRPFIFFMALLAGFMSCVSTSRYQSLASRSEQLQINNNDLKKENDSLSLISKELQLTKEQLAKTENVLIEFYQKYERKSPTNDKVASIKNESQWDTAQIEMTKLVQENSRLHDEIKKYEIELSDLGNLLQEYSNKLALTKENRKSNELRSKQLEESKSSHKKTKSELDIKDTSLTNLKYELATSKADKTELQNQAKHNEFLIDSLHSEIQYLGIKNKDLALQISDLNAKIEEDARLNREMQNSDKINLQNEITNLNIKLHPSENDTHSLLDSLKLKNDEVISLQKTLEEYNTIANLQKAKPEEKSNHKNNEDKKEEISKLKSDLNLSEKSLSALNDAIIEKNEEIKDLKKKLEGKTEEITYLKEQITSKDKSKTTGLSSELKTEPIDAEKIEHLSRNFQIEKDSLITNLNKVHIEKDKYILENQGLTEELHSKNKQIELLSLKFSEQPDLNEISLSLKPLQDSVRYLQNEKIRMQHVNKSLETEIRRNQSAMSTRESIIDSLKNVIRISNTNVANIDKTNISKPIFEIDHKKDQDIDHQAIQQPTQHDKEIHNPEEGQIKQDIKKSQKETTSSKRKIDSFKENSIPIQINNKSVIGNLPAPLIEKIKSFAIQYEYTGLISFKDNSALFIIIPQSYAFEGERLAMTQVGSELIMKLSSILKAYPAIKINLTGFGSPDASGIRSFESNFKKRANTVYKLMGVSGINPNKINLGSQLNSDYLKKQLPPAGIEIKIHAE